MKLISKTFRVSYTCVKCKSQLSPKDVHKAACCPSCGVMAEGPTLRVRPKVKSYWSLFGYPICKAKEVT